MFVLRSAELARRSINDDACHGACRGANESVRESHLDGLRGDARMGSDNRIGDAVGAGSIFRSSFGRSCSRGRRVDTRVIDMKKRDWVAIRDGGNQTTMAHRYQY